MNGPVTGAESGRDALADRFRRFATIECPGISPLYARLAMAAADNHLALDLAGQRQPGQPPANILLGAVHFLLQEGIDHPLRRFYPDLDDDPPGTGDVGPALDDFLHRHQARISAIVTRRIVGTNEVRRAAPLRPALQMAGHVLAQAAPDRAPTLVEFGASAGLLLGFDAYGYDYGDGARYGPADATVTLRSALRGSLPAALALPMPRFANRLGLELNPLDIRDPEDRAWLRALVWPEQRERFALLDAALDHARRNPPEIRVGDGLELLPRLADELPASVPLCLYHSFVLYQLPETARQRFREILGALSRDRPVAEVGFEWDGREAARLSLRIHDAGRCLDDRELARAGAHGEWLEWLGDGAPEAADTNTEEP
ncbi:DUF2332 domain-containing protein [Oceanibacterium hippocampi]|uniref:DUF2332 domain-containing protein n=1 Tax=Oceanibacterium hippocampi TaxID=745714 RepID=A0A1Y5TS18_9PROT|nr:DUF2332 domain-containing protein [Oceanibacterium hippocampi]SLN68811.1 hypothetical protein OCH7691_03131 [Oceanibacterium hippocampi]